MVSYKPDDVGDEIVVMKLLGPDMVTEVMSADGRLTWHCSLTGCVASVKPLIGLAGSDVNDVTAMSADRSEIKQIILNYYIQWT